MSDEQRNDEEIEAHVKKPLANDEPAEDTEDEVEAHRMPSVRMDSPSNS